MIPAILIWRDGHETEQLVEPGTDIRVVSNGAATEFRRVGMVRSRFVYVEAVEQARTLSAVPEATS